MPFKHPTLSPNLPPWDNLPEGTFDKRLFNGSRHCELKEHQM